MATRSLPKLCARYFGPFPIVKRVGQVAYQLALPSTTYIHDVFHISLLKLFKGDQVDQPLPLPPEIVHHHPIVEPKAILKHRVIDVQGQSVTQVLVWW